MSDDRDLAQACAAVLLSGDGASRSLGMVLQAVEPGYARMAMVVRPDMLNGHGTAHGGMIFALADSAFAIACNSRNVATVGQDCTIRYLAPGRSGETLTAEARETALVGRLGTYDVTVRGGDGRIIALFRGHSAARKDRVLPEEPQS